MKNMKNLFNRAKGAAGTQASKNKDSNSSIGDENDDRNFDIDLQNLWKYDLEDLTEFINKYERYINEIKKKQSFQNAEINHLKEKIELIEKDKKKLIEENEQYKINLEKLQIIINQKAEEQPKQLSEVPSKKFQLDNQFESLIEETIKERIKLKVIVEDAVFKTTDNINQLRSKLSSLKNQIKSNVEDAGSKSVIETTNISEQAITQEVTSDSPNSDSKINDLNSSEVAVSDCDSWVMQITQTINQLNTNLNAWEQEIIVNLKNDIVVILGNSLNNAVDEELLKEYKNKIEEIEKNNSELRNKIENNENQLRDIIEENNILKNKNNEQKDKLDKLDKQLKDLKEEITKINKINQNMVRVNGEFKDRQEKLEKCLKESKDNEKILNDSILSLRQDINSKNNLIEELKGRADKSDKLCKDLEIEKINLSNQVKLLKETYSDFAIKHRASEDLRMEIDNLMKQITSLLEEKTRIEDKKRDLENKLIQERLMNDQKQRDYNKLDENYKDARKNLAEQIEITKEKGRKIEALEADINKINKTMKEYKKSCKEYKSQIVELQTKMDKFTTEKQDLEKNLNEANAKLSKRDEEKDLEFNSRLIEIKELKTVVENLKSKNDELLKNQADLEAEKEKLTSQLNILHEKRETGLKEIQRLNGIIEGLKMGSNNSYMASSGQMSPSLSRNCNTETQTPTNLKDSGVISKTTSMKFASHTVESEDRFKKSNNTNRASAETLKIIQYVKDIKRSLDLLYRNLIDVITSEEFEAICNTQKNDSITSVESKKYSRNSIISFNIPEKFIFLEKKVNDAILNIQDFIVTLEDNYAPQIMS